MKIARQFHWRDAVTCGNPAPEARLKNPHNPQSFQDGMHSILADPALETPGYSQASLRDSSVKCLCGRRSPKLALSEVEGVVRRARPGASKLFHNFIFPM